MEKCVWKSTCFFTSFLDFILSCRDRFLGAWLVGKSIYVWMSLCFFFLVAHRFSVEKNMFWKVHVFLDFYVLGTWSIIRGCPRLGAFRTRIPCRAVILRFLYSFVVYGFFFRALFGRWLRDASSPSPSNWLTHKPLLRENVLGFGAPKIFKGGGFLPKPE